MASLASEIDQSSCGKRSSSKKVKATELGSSTCAAGDQLAERAKWTRLCDDRSRGSSVGRMGACRAVAMVEVACIGSLLRGEITMLVVRTVVRIRNAEEVRECGSRDGRDGASEQSNGIRVRRCCQSFRAHSLVGTK